MQKVWIIEGEEAQRLRGTDRRHSLAQFIGRFVPFPLFLLFYPLPQQTLDFIGRVFEKEIYP